MLYLHMMSNTDDKNMSLQGEEPGAERQGVGSVNDNESIPSLNLDALVCPDGPISKTSGVAGLECLKDPLDDAIVETNNILVPKDKRGQFGSHDYLRNLDAAT